MTGSTALLESLPKNVRRILGLVVLGASFGTVCGTVTGWMFGLMSGLDLIDAVMGAAAGGLLGGAVAMLLVGILGGRKCCKLDPMKSAVFSGAFGTILGGIAGLYLLEFFAGRNAGNVSKLGDDLMIILFVAAGAGSVVMWAVSHLSRREKCLQYAVLGMFVSGVACAVITPATIPFGIGGAVAGLLSQRMLVQR